MIKSGKLIISLLICSLCVLEIDEAKSLERPIVGRIETVKIDPGDIVLRAKLDTGADSSSLSSENAQFFQKGPELWVRFSIRNREGEQRQMELKVLKTVSIKRDNGKIDKRPVVRLGVCMGNFYMMVDANLADRSDLAYPMLIGRDFITGNLVIDSSRSYTVDPVCKILEKNKKKMKYPYEAKH
ncbi:MAG: hypothetical protein GYA55_08440 [SAR324 cluster bacterium]|uniref:Retropepsin-like aspartic endopeptidase domain-containing protein n=1 Tax=SAR324 cluster bacterium TaxID=2024889 RepID=A0A7X9FRZ8_9DELT|nr:hypothetical protein [SAR324 cluster bacterium]